MVLEKEKLFCYKNLFYEAGTPFLSYMKHNLFFCGGQSLFIILLSDGTNGIEQANEILHVLKMDKSDKILTPKNCTFILKIEMSLKNNHSYSEVLYSV